MHFNDFLSIKGYEDLSKKDCVVEEVKSGLRKPCQFPFIFSNQTFYGCTIFQGENGNPWCSTKVDPLGRVYLFKSLACYLALTTLLPSHSAPTILVLKTWVG